MSHPGTDAGFLRRSHTDTIRLDQVPSGPVGHALIIIPLIVVWVLGIILSDRFADDLFLSPWIGRIIGILFPIVGPVVLAIMRQRARNQRT